MAIELCRQDPHHSIGLGARKHTAPRFGKYEGSSGEFVGQVERQLSRFCIIIL